MTRNIIKSYAEKLEVKDVIKFGLKEGISVSEEEASIFLETVKANIDYILDGNGLELIESKKEEFSLETYEKILELFNKYKKFIG